MEEKKKAEEKVVATADLPNGSVKQTFTADAAEATMTLKHAEFVAAARIRRDMDGHLNRAMEAKLNLNVALAGAAYVNALEAYEAIAG